MATSFITHVQAGTHAARPGAGTVPQGTLYACSTHGLIYQSDGTSTWSEWLDPSDATSSFGSNVNAVGQANAGGSSNSNTRSDHVHLGVRSVSHTSNTYSGPIILTASGIVGITSPTAGTFDITAAATGGSGGSAGVTVQDEGTPLATTATTLNFVGAGVAATGAGATKTITIGGGGGGLAQSFIGYNTVGGSWETLVGNRCYYKSVTLAGAGILVSIDVYLRPSIDNLEGLHVMVADDNAGEPGVLRGGGGFALNEVYLSNSASMPGAGRWVSLPVGAYLAAGTYWIGCQAPNGRLDLAYDGSGSDHYFTPGNFFAVGGYPSAYAITTGTRNYSIRGNLLA